jgi:hypothetical protein
MHYKSARAIGALVVRKGIESRATTEGPRGCGCKGAISSIALLVLQGAGANDTLLVAPLCMGTLPGETP